MVNPTAAKLQVKLELMPKDGKDLNLICSIVYAEYMVYVKTLDALLMPQQVLKRMLDGAMSSVDNAVYDTLSHGMGTLNTALQKVMPTPLKLNLKMDAGLGVVGGTLALTCTDFLGSLPQELFNLFEDIKHGLKSLSEVVMPGNLMKEIADSILSIKDEAMKGMFGALFDTVLSPFIAYDAFLQENGVPDLIKKLERMERCMTKQGICGRPTTDFMEPTTHKLWSSYFKSQFLLSSKGTINIKSSGGSSKQKSQMSNIYKSMNSFRVSIK